MILGIARRLVSYAGATRVRALQLAIIFTTVILGASFYPFRMKFDGPKTLPNGASTLPGGGMQFEGPSFVQSPETPAWNAAAIEAESLRLRVVCETSSANQSGPARLVTLSDGPYRRNFMIAQKGPDLIVRVRRATSDENGAAPLKVDGVFLEEGPREIDVSIARDVIEIQVDGVPRYREKQESSPFASWERNGYTFALGDEVDGAREWNGRLDELDIEVAGAPVFSLGTGDDLSVPETLWHVPERARGFLSIDPSKFFITALAHFVSFAIFGALVWLASRRRSHIGAWIGIALLGALLGTAIQIGKLFFEARHPSLFHAIPNGVGSFAGAWFCSLLVRHPGLGDPAS